MQRHCGKGFLTRLSLASLDDHQKDRRSPLRKKTWYASAGKPVECALVLSSAVSPDLTDLSVIGAYAAKDIGRHEPLGRVVLGVTMVVVDKAAITGHSPRRALTRPFLSLLRTALKNSRSRLEQLLRQSVRKSRS